MAEVWNQGGQDRRYVLAFADPDGAVPAAALRNLVQIANGLLPRTEISPLPDLVSSG